MTTAASAVSNDRNMRLRDLLARPMPEAWAYEKIPWHEGEFSRRMLGEHLAQTHDRASRRLEIVDEHVSRIHHIIGDATASVLDLCCGPGLYATRLARLGHPVRGIDFAPAAIAYARERARDENVACEFIEADVRRADYGSGYALAMLIFGEFNMFSPDDAALILSRVHSALAPNGQVLIEAHGLEFVRALGKRPRWWTMEARGVFSDEPYLCLMENRWEESSSVAVQRYYVVDVESGDVDVYGATMQAYSDGEMKALLEANGFEGVKRQRWAGATDLLLWTATAQG